MEARMWVYDLGAPPEQIVVDITAAAPGAVRLNLLGPHGQYIEDLAVPLEEVGSCVRHHAEVWQAGTVFFRCAANLPLPDIADWMCQGLRATPQAAE